MRPFYNRGDILSELKRKEVRQLTEDELRPGAQALCHALSCIHKAGYLHGDVRPQNIVRHDSGKKGAKV